MYQDETSEEGEEVVSTQATHGVSSSDIFIELMVKSFPSECKGSLQSLVEEAKSEWRETILLLFNQCYPRPSSTDFSALLSDTSDQATAGAGCPILESRSAKPLVLKRLNELSMVPVRAAKSSALQSRMVSSASSATHIRKTRNDTHMQTIAADERGRLYIAESSSVLFCSAIPSVNSRYVENSKAAAVN